MPKTVEQEFIIQSYKEERSIEDTLDHYVRNRSIEGPFGQFVREDILAFGNVLKERFGWADTQLRLRWPSLFGRITTSRNR